MSMRVVMRWHRGGGKNLFYLRAPPPPAVTFGLVHRSVTAPHVSSLLRTYVPLAHLYSHRYSHLSSHLFSHISSSGRCAVAVDRSVFVCLCACVRLYVCDFVFVVCCVCYLLIFLHMFITCLHASRSGQLAQQHFGDWPVFTPLFTPLFTHVHNVSARASFRSTRSTTFW